MDSLSKYNIAANICGNTYNLLKNNILEKNITNIKQLYDIGMNSINTQCNTLNVVRKGVAYPISISLNNKIDHYTYDHENPNIKKNDIVKIKLGVDIDGCIAMYSNTFIYNNENMENSYITFLNNLKDKILKQMYVGNTNDELRIYIETKCTKAKCFPITNNKSYQHLNNQIYNNDGKYMILNYKKLYDRNEYIIQKNDCFDFEENEIYTINISIVPDDDNNDYKIKIDDSQSLYRLNDIYHGFKLKTSRVFHSLITKNHNFNVFNISEYLNDTKLRLGIKECVNNKILERLPASFIDDNNKNVYSITFTVCIMDNNAVLLKYF